MSHFARIVEALTVWTVATREEVTLAVDTEIKRVKVVEGGFRFEAHSLIGNGRDRVWLVLETDEDLPAFTDKGRAHRARQVHATLQPGRPLTGEEHVVRPIAFRPTSTQRKWIERRATRKQLTVSEYVRSCLEADGMPR